MTQKNIFLVILIIVIVLGVGFFAYDKLKSNIPETENPVDTTGIVLFYGDDCSYCKILEEWIVSNNIREKIKFSDLEVYNNETNRDLLIGKATACGIKDNIGVPFLWTGESCLVKNEEIQNFFQNKIK